jgi:hypothetical protein
LRIVFETLAVLRYVKDTIIHACATTHQCFAALLLTWISAYFCIWKGVNSASAAVKLTVLLPWALLAILIIYNATLEGSRDGVELYIGKWDMDVLKQGEAWSAAAGQVFLSLGCALGVCQPCILHALCFCRWAVHWVCVSPPSCMHCVFVAGLCTGCVSALHLACIVSSFGFQWMLQLRIRAFTIADE